MKNKIGNLDKGKLEPDVNVTNNLVSHIDTKYLVCVPYLNIPLIQDLRIVSQLCEWLHSSFFSWDSPVRYHNITKALWCIHQLYVLFPFHPHLLGSLFCHIVHVNRHSPNITGGSAMTRSRYIRRSLFVCSKNVSKHLGQFPVSHDFHMQKVNVAINTFTSKSNLGNLGNWVSYVGTKLSNGTNVFILMGFEATPSGGDDDSKATNVECRVKCASHERYNIKHTWSYRSGHEVSCQHL